MEHTGDLVISPHISLRRCLRWCPPSFHCELRSCQLPRAVRPGLVLWVGLFRVSSTIPGYFSASSADFASDFFAVGAHHITPHTFIFYLVYLPWHIIGYHSATRRLRSMGGVMSTSLWWCCWRLLRFWARIDAGSLLCNHGHSR